MGISSDILIGALNNVLALEDSGIINNQTWIVGKAIKPFFCKQGHI